MQQFREYRQKPQFQMFRYPFCLLPCFPFDNPHFKVDKSTCQGKFTNCYNSYSLLQLPQKDTKRENHYTKPRNLSIGINPRYQEGTQKGENHYTISLSLSIGENPNKKKTNK